MKSIDGVRSATYFSQLTPEGVVHHRGLGTPLTTEGGKGSLGTSEKVWCSGIEPNGRYYRGIRADVVLTDGSTHRLEARTPPAMREMIKALVAEHEATSMP